MSAGRGLLFPRAWRGFLGCCRPSACPSGAVPEQMQLLQMWQLSSAAYAGLPCASWELNVEIIEQDVLGGAEQHHGGVEHPSRSHPARLLEQMTEDVSCHGSDRGMGPGLRQGNHGRLLAAGGSSLQQSELSLGVLHRRHGATCRTWGAAAVPAHHGESPVGCSSGRAQLCQRFGSLKAFPELSALSFSCCLSFSPVLEVRAGSVGVRDGQSCALSAGNHRRVTGSASPRARCSGEASEGSRAPVGGLSLLYEPCCAFLTPWVSAPTCSGLAADPELRLAPADALLLSCWCSASLAASAASNSPPGSL